ncbi:MAG: DUF3097 family protein [Actinomycetota bacterium]|nr:DUF3097 family protein [Actinomycetota bacterium]
MSGILSEPLDINGPRRPRPSWPKVPGSPGLTVRHRAHGHVGVILRYTPDWIVIRDRNGREHTLRNEPGAFSVDGRTVALVAPPRAKGPDSSALTASGSVAVPSAAARVAQPSRILVEGIHDAELVEKVWGDDLRIEGIVVQPLHGADDLEAVVRNFGPRPGRRLGVLLDHLVDGSKETRIAQQVYHPDVLITGHPYVDIWQAVRPQVVGLETWPTVRKGTDWKTGIARAIGFSGEPGVLWKQILGRVSNYKDLEAPLVGAVESLIDFVTLGGPGGAADL